MPAAPLIADHLTRSFDDRVAVSDLSLSVESGEVVCLLGPNGAGKTTTLRMLAGLIPPTSGRIFINHLPVSPVTANAARGSIGLLTEAPGLWERLTVRMNLVTYARLYGLQAADDRVVEALALVDLIDRADDLAGTLSKGLKQRAAIARALVHRPPVILLDEPTAGLDPASARHIRDLIVRLRGDGRAVLVSTHNLGEAEELSDRIAILRTRLLTLDTPAALRGQATVARVLIEVEGDASVWTSSARQTGASSVETRGTELSATFDDASLVPELVARLAASGARITRVVPDQRGLEQVYLDLVGRP